MMTVRQDFLVSSAVLALIMASPVGLLRSGFMITVDDVQTAQLHTIPEQAAIVEDLIAGCWP